MAKDKNLLETFQPGVKKMQVFRWDKETYYMCQDMLRTAIRRHGWINYWENLASDSLFLWGKYGFIGSEIAMRKKVKLKLSL
jgi:hypothetical protein